MPSKKLTGRTDARMTKYVGEHVLKMGPSDAPTIASPHKDFCINPVPINLFDDAAACAKPGIDSHTEGNTSVMPNRNKMPPEMYVHTSGGTITNAVETLSMKVNAMTESAKDPTTTYGVHLLRPAADEPMTTGSNGKMHGAKTVKSPAMNATTRNVTCR